MRKSCEWIRQHAPDDAVLGLGQGPWGALLAERRSVAFPRTRDSRAFLAFLDRFGVTHVIQNGWPHSLRYLAPAMESQPGRFREVHREGSTVVFKVLP